MARNNMKKVVAFGTFDLLHPGHLFYLNEAKKLGDYLFVIVSTVRNAEKIKGKKPLNREKTRLERVKKLRPVDYVSLGSEKDMFYFIKEIRPDVIALGYDQKADWLEERLKKEKLKAKIVKIKPFEEDKYKSSLISKRIFEID